MKKMKRFHWTCWHCGAKFSARDILTLSMPCMTSPLSGINNSGVLAFQLWYGGVSNCSEVLGPTDPDTRSSSRLMNKWGGKRFV